MWNWFLMLGGMLVWAIHFGGVYATASVFDALSAADVRGALWTVAALTAACLIANTALLAVNLRGLKEDAVIAWMRSVGAVLAALSFISVIWQGLPALIR